MITIRLGNGIVYKNFSSASVYKNVETLVGNFIFESSYDNNMIYPILLNDYIEILVDDEQVLNGYVENIEIINNIDNRCVRFSGRSLLCDLIDSSMENSKEFSGVNTKLENICKKVMVDLGLYTKVINKAGEIEDFKKDEIQSAETSTTCFDFLETLAEKRQIFLNSDGYGNLLLLRGSDGNSDNSIRNIISSNDNNTISSSLKLDTTKRFFRYTVKSDVNITNAEVQIDPITIVNQIGVKYDSAIRPTRVLEITPSENISSYHSEERAKWEVNIRKTRGFSYSASVQGHSVKTIIDNKVVNKLWEINKIINVNDNFCKLNDNLLIKSVEYNYSIDKGSITNIKCVPKESYTILIKPKKGYDTVSVWDRIWNPEFNKNEVINIIRQFDINNIPQKET